VSGDAKARPGGLFHPVGPRTTHAFPFFFFEDLFMDGVVIVEQEAGARGYVSIPSAFIM
jgi:hypothetical protein